MTKDPQLTLFDTIDDAPAATTSTAPNCNLCGRPRRWNPRQRDWTRYCGGSQCTSPTRICRQCGRTYNRDQGGTRYCSPDCLTAWHTYRPGPQTAAARLATARRCDWCDQPFEPGSRKNGRETINGATLCPQCIAPVVPVLGRLRRHHVPADMIRALAADPVCPICGVDVITPTRAPNGEIKSLLVVDHDHECCPGNVSCGDCVRGLPCFACNAALGLLRERPETFEAAAAYLRSAKLRGKLP